MNSAKYQNTSQHTKTSCISLKYLGVNLTKEVEDLYNLSDKILLKEA